MRRKRGQAAHFSFKGCSDKLKQIGAGYFTEFWQPAD